MSAQLQTSIPRASYQDSTTFQGHKYLIIPPQHLIVLLTKTELAQRLKRDLPRSETVAARHSFMVKVVSSQQETAGREIWFLGMSYLDETRDNVGLPAQ